MHRDGCCYIGGGGGLHLGFHHIVVIVTCHKITVLPFQKACLTLMLLSYPIPSHPTPSHACVMSSFAYLLSSGGLAKVIRRWSPTKWHTWRRRWNSWRLALKYSPCIELFLLCTAGVICGSSPRQHSVVSLAVEKTAVIPTRGHVQI